MKFKRRKSIKEDKCRSEISQTKFIPFQGHWDENIIITKNNELMSTIQVEGFSFETADDDDLDIKKEILNTLFKSVAGGDCALYFHIIRKRESASVPGDFDNKFCRKLNDAWREKHEGKISFKNDLYVTVVKKEDTEGAVGKTAGMFSKITQVADAEAQDIVMRDKAKSLKEITSRLMGSLKSYKPKLLGIRENEKGSFSEVFEFFGQIINGGIHSNMMVPTTNADKYLSKQRIYFGKTALEMRDEKGQSRFGGAITIKEYPSSTNAGMLDSLLQLPFEMIVTHAFYFSNFTLQGSFWAQLPTNFEYIARPSVINTLNLVGLCSLHNYPYGKRVGNHWGPAVTDLDTTSGTPFYFNFHVRDVGHSMIIGPTGAGKTVMLGFLAAMSQKYKPDMFFFDKDRGAEIMIRAIGGTFTILNPAKKMGFNPLKLEDSPENREFLFELLTALASESGKYDLTPEEKEQIIEAIKGNYKLPFEARVLRNIAPFFGLEKPGSIASRLRVWHSGEARAGVFDNDEDGLSFDGKRVHGFEMAPILESPDALGPVLLYVFHRINMTLTGSPTVIILDEAWALLDNPVFAPKIKNWLKVLRKLNGMVVFATQSPEDVANSRISETLVQQTSTQIFLANMKATSVYQEVFKLSNREYALKICKFFILIFTALLIFLAAEDSFAQTDPIPPIPENPNFRISTDCSDYPGFINKIVNCVTGMVKYSVLEELLTKVHGAFVQAANGAIIVYLMLFGFKLMLGGVDNIKSEIFIVSITCVMILYMNNTTKIIDVVKLFIKGQSEFANAATVAISESPLNNPDGTQEIVCVGPFATDADGEIIYRDGVPRPIEVDGERVTFNVWQRVDCVIGYIMGVHPAFERTGQFFDRNVKKDSGGATVDKRRYNYEMFAGPDNPFANMAEDPFTFLADPEKAKVTENFESFLSFSLVSIGLSMLFSDSMGIIVMLTGLFIIFLMIAAFGQAALIYITSLFAIVVLALFAPIIIPLFLFKFTRKIFDFWLQMFFTYMLQPGIMLAYLTFMVFVLQYVINYKGASSNGVEGKSLISYHFGESFIKADTAPWDPVSYVENLESSFSDNNKTFSQFSKMTESSIIDIQDVDTYSSLLASDDLQKRAAQIELIERVNVADTFKNVSGRTANLSGVKKESISLPYHKFYTGVDVKGGAEKQFFGNIGGGILANMSSSDFIQRILKDDEFFKEISELNAEDQVKAFQDKINYMQILLVVFLTISVTFAFMQNVMAFGNEMAGAGTLPVAQAVNVYNGLTSKMAANINR